MAKLTHERLRELLSYNPETGVFTWRARPANCIHVGDVAGTEMSDGYRRIGVDGKRYRAHRLAWLYVHGEWPVQVDHINGVPGDDWIGNLREAKSQIEQQQNRKLRSDNTSGHQGVHWHKRDGKWVAQVAHKGKIHHLGYFDDIQEAARARRAAKRKYHKFCPEARSA